jgi:hypothetical protein
MTGHWVFTEAGYLRLIAQGFVTHKVENRNGVTWRYMVKGARP